MSDREPGAPSPAGLAGAAWLYGEKQYEEALSQYALLAEHGDEFAARWAGWIIYRGLCTRKDPQEAIRYYILAAESGSKVALFELASMYAHVGDYPKAVECYERSAGEGYLPALYRLGPCCYSGKGVHQDEEKAIAYFEEAARGGHVFAKSRLMRRQLVHDYGRVVGWILFKLWCLKESVEIARIVMREEESQSDERLVK